MQNCKLSDRFIKSNNKIKIQEQEAEVKSVVESVEDVSLRETLLEKVNSIPYWSEYELDKQRNMVRNFVDNLKIQLSEDAFENLMSSVVGFGALQNLLNNSKVSAVFVNGINSVHIEIDGRVFNTEMKLSKNMLLFALNSVGYKDEMIYSSKVENYLVDVIKSGNSTDNTNIVIRKIKKFSVEDLINDGAITQELYDFLVLQIQNKKRIVISGSSNSGKTSLLDVILSSISNTRTYILESVEQLSATSDSFVRICTSKFDLSQLLKVVTKSNPEYLVADLNAVKDEYSISTLKASSLENAFNTLVSTHSFEMSEKSAKLHVLTNFDYIVHMDNFKVVSVAELKPARTMALSLRVIYER